MAAKQNEELKLMQNCLLDLASQCQSNEAPHCAILDRFSDPTPNDIDQAIDQKNLNKLKGETL